jgi:hypothetical protein
VKNMTSREILDAIRRGLEESARPFGQSQPQPAPLPPTRRPIRSMEQMTSREILDAIHRGLQDTARQFVADGHSPTQDHPSDDRAK